MKISLWIIGIIVISLFAGMLGYFMSDLYSSYPTTDYNNNSNMTGVQFYDKLDYMKNLTEDVKNSAIDDKTNRNLFDIIGSFLQSGLSSIKLALSSMDVTASLINDGSRQLQLPDIFRIAAWCIAIIAIIAVFIGLKVGRDV